ncbi:sugar O-acetyltransferase [Cryobacterium sp. PAMC25264]|uniref:sugar O-acetyltransferase n=1 Tax=Cryobacterium sp. PAMC25264 TaxID=2861288 RepID=UPI0021062823|nr:sugar O-acetyltransferase [Cryobacterium sp. PAMC25264]
MSETAKATEDQMMDARERDVRNRMDQHQLYTDSGAGLEALTEERLRGKDLADDFNATRARDESGRHRILLELFGSMGENVWVEPPLRVAYGNHVHVGHTVYANFNLTLVDDVDIYIGDRVMFAPNVTITTTGHPVHPELRRDGSQFSAPVHIEDDVWIGSGAIILPGVTIGAGAIVGAGSIVTANVPAGVVVAGSPARIIRTISDADRQFSYRAPRDLQ